MARRLLGVTAIVLAAAILLPGCSKKSTSEATITACKADSGGGKPTAEGQVTNSSSKGSAFLIRIGFYDSSGNRVSEGADTVSGVGAGSSAPWHVTGAADANGKLTCKVLEVRRSVAPGS